MMDALASAEVCQLINDVIRGNLTKESTFNCTNVINTQVPFVPWCHPRNPVATGVLHVVRDDELLPSGGDFYVIPALHDSRVGPSHFRLDPTCGAPCPPIFATAAGVDD